LRPPLTIRQGAALLYRITADNNANAPAKVAPWASMVWVRAAMVASYKQGDDDSRGSEGAGNAKVGECHVRRLEATAKI
jgi:hypothetical protein